MCVILIIWVLKPCDRKMFWSWEPSIFIVHKVAPLQGQSPWKRLLVFRKSVQTKQVFTRLTVLDKNLSSDILFY